MMSTGQQSSSGGITEQQKLYAMVVLLAVFAGIWIWRFTKPGAGGASAKGKPKPPVGTPAIEDTLSKALDKVTDLVGTVAGPTPAKSKTRTPRPVASLQRGAAELSPILVRDPFAVSEVLAALTGKPEPKPEEDSEGNEKSGADVESVEPDRPVIVLRATMVQGGRKYALLDQDIAVEGQIHQEMKVVSIGEREVVLEGPHGQVRLTME